MYKATFIGKFLLLFIAFSIPVSVFAGGTIHKCAGGTVSASWSSSFCPSGTVSVSGGGDCSFSSGSTSGGAGPWTMPSGGSCSATITCSGATPDSATVIVDAPGVNGCPYLSCNVAPFGTVNHGSSVTAYQTSSVPYGNTCASVSQTRTCTNGSLSGSYGYDSCSVDPPTGVNGSCSTSLDMCGLGRRIVLSTMCIMLNNKGPAGVAS